MAGLQCGSILAGLVAPHPEAEDMTNEDLLDALASGKFVDHLQGVFHRAVQGVVAAVEDFARGVHGFIELGGAAEAKVVVHLERETEGIHLAVAPPALSGPYLSQHLVINKFPEAVKNNPRHLEGVLTPDLVQKAKEKTVSSFLEDAKKEVPQKTATDENGTALMDDEGKEKKVIDYPVAKTAASSGPGFIPRHY